MCARTIAIQVDRNEVSGFVDEFLAIEDRYLDLIARWAPDRAPIQKQRFIASPGFGERCLKIIVFAPVDRSIAVTRWRCQYWVRVKRDSSQKSSKKVGQDFHSKAAF